jgi:PAS domain S-box-containing protein
MSDTRDSSDGGVCRRALDRVSDGIVALDSEFQFTYLNDSAIDLLDSSESELLGEPVWDVFPDAADSVAEQRIRQAAEVQETVSYERYNDSVDSWFDVRVYPDEDGISLIFKDISEQKQREHELEWYERLVENLPVAVGQVESGKDGSLVYVNDETAEMFGAESKAEVKQYPVQEFYADAEKRERVEQELQDTGRVDDYEVEFETVDGERFWGSLTASLVGLEDETQLLGVSQDAICCDASRGCNDRERNRGQHHWIRSQRRPPVRRICRGTGPDQRL